MIYHYYTRKSRKSDPKSPSCFWAFEALELDTNMFKLAGWYGMSEDEIGGLGTPMVYRSISSERIILSLLSCLSLSPSLTPSLPVFQGSRVPCSVHDVLEY